MLDIDARAAIEKTNQISSVLADRYSDLRDLIQLMINCVLTHESIIVFAPPGFGLSSLVRDLTQHFSLSTFSYSIFDYTTPDELFGPIDLNRLRAGRAVHFDRYSLTSAHVAFLDEVFKTNSAVLNSLISILAERTYLVDGVVRTAPLRSIFFRSAADVVPEDMRAFFDRISVRFFITSQFHKQNLLDNLERWTSFARMSLTTPGDISAPVVTIDELDLIYSKLSEVSLDPVIEQIMSFATSALELGINLSPRRLFQVSKMISVAALRRYDLSPTAADLWSLPYIGDDQNQLKRLRTILQAAGAGRNAPENTDARPGGPKAFIRRGTLKVFLSYSSHDKAFAERLANDLKNSGVDVWFDKWEILVGESMVRKIAEGIEGTNFLIVVLSPASMESKWVERELNSAVMRELAEHAVVILPVMCQHCSLPTIISDKKYADFRYSYEEGLNQLMEAVSRRADNKTDTGDGK